MTDHDQDAEVGRLVRERRELRAHHQALVSKLQQIGKLLSCVGNGLTVRPPGRPYPEHTLTIGEDGQVRVSDEYQSQSILTGAFPTFSELRILLLEEKDIGKRLADVEAQLKAFGA